MTSELKLLSDSVRRVFLIPESFSVTAASLLAKSADFSEPYRTITLSFLDNLSGMIRTLSLPFEFTQRQVNDLHWQRFFMAERIRAIDEPNQDEIAYSKAKIKFQEFLDNDGQTVVIRDVLQRLQSLAEDQQSLGTARELTRQAIVLTWSAFEVLARDLFVNFLNKNPASTERLLSDPVARKRFAIEKLDWQTLSLHSFNLSNCLGNILSQRSDLDDIQTIREAFGALFPDSQAMAKSLADHSLWFLFQKRNLIVHRRGIVDHHYLAKTGDTLLPGSQLVTEPDEVENLALAVLKAGEAVLTEAANAN